MKERESRSLKLNTIERSDSGTFFGALAATWHVKCSRHPEAVEAGRQSDGGCRLELKVQEQKRETGVNEGS